MKPHERILLNESISTLNSLIDRGIVLDYTILCLANQYANKKGLTIETAIEVEGIISKVGHEFNRIITAQLEDNKEIDPIRQDVYQYINNQRDAF
jgi:hypothetical protein